MLTIQEEAGTLGEIVMIPRRGGDSAEKDISGECPEPGHFRDRIKRDAGIDTDW